MNLKQILICLVHLVTQFSCQNPQCAKQSCAIPGSPSCIQPTYDQCIDQNIACVSYNLSNYIGRDINDYTCLKNKQTDSKSNAQCWNSTQYQICITNSNNQCIDYSLETNISSIYVGLLNNTNQQQSLYQCLQVNNKANKDQIISLKIPFCLDQTNTIKNLTVSQNNFVGIDAKNLTCLKMNITATNSSISYCSEGFCQYNNTCTQLSKYLPAKLANLECAQLNTPTAIECYKDSQNPFTSQSLCLDQENNSCAQIEDLSQYSIGILPNGTCVQQNKAYDKIQVCSDQSCLIKNGTGFSCIPFDDVYIGIDKDNMCLKRNEQSAIRCKKLKFCREILIDICVDLQDDQKDKSRIGRELNTTYCLQYSDQEGQNIEICADGYCLYSATNQENSYFCVPYGGYLQNNGPFIGVESVTERCLQIDQQVNNIMLCYGQNYCKLTKNQKQACVKLYYPFSYDDIDPQQNDYAAKNSDGTCQSINQANSVSCAEIQLCLQGDKCISLNNQNSQDSESVGRDANTQRCIESEKYYAIYCKLDYCLYDNKCKKLDSYYVGREYYSSNCLLDSQQTSQNIKQCLDGYCIFQQSPQQYSCIKLDYDPSKNAIGYDQNLQCLGVGQPVAVQCFQGMACFEQNTCQIVDPQSTYKCSDSQNNCSKFIDNCSQCNFSQCVNPQDGKTCVPLGNNCQDSLGMCADSSSGQCRVCPQNTCLDQKTGICRAFLNILLKENQCIKYIRPDKQCEFVDMNVYTDDSDIKCANYQNICILQSQANPSFQCLRCPKNFLNLGDNQCLTIQQRDTDQNKTTNSALYFQLNVSYNIEDNCQGQICKQQNIKKCPKGCYSCKDLDFCTKCIEGYFLYKTNENSAQCIQCDYQYNSVSSFQDTFRVPLNTASISQKCLDCSLEAGLWKTNQMSQKICQQVILKFSNSYNLNITLVENKPPFAMSYIIGPINSTSQFQYPKYQLTTSNLCTQSYCSFCQFQNQQSQYLQVCLKCQLGYYLDMQGQCKNCEQGCLQCELGFLDSSGIKQYYYEYSEQQRQILRQLTLIPLCQVCKPTQLISYNLTTCDQCGQDCTSCQYVNQNSYFNIGWKNNIQLTDSQYTSNSIFKQCNSCSQSSQTLSSEGDSCGEQIQNCVLQSLQNKKTGQINLVYDLSSYKDGQSGSERICVACQSQFILQYSKGECLRNPEIKDVNCLQFYGDNLKCKQCNKFALNTTQNSCDLNFKCKQQIFGCSKCLYQYESSEQQQQQIQYFTCVECSNVNYMVTLLGCIKCQEGCQRCFEMGYDSQQQLYNITAHIMYEDFEYNITTRLNYKSILKAQTYCSSCLPGYQFDPIQKTCILFPCGSLCNNCIFQNNKFFCIECNQIAILQSTKSIQLFMGNFFFKQNYVNQQLQISTFTQDQKQCQSCPLLCETCDQTNNLFDNDYFIYQTKCFSCKTIQQLSLTGQTLQSYFYGYEIRFDKERFRCTLCKIDDQSCYFSKSTKLYVNCNTYSSQVGDGTIYNPLNLNMLSEVSNFDSLILGEKNYNLAFVALNEISLKQLDLELVFSSEIKECFALKPLEIKSKLLEKIKTLQIFHLNITYEQSANKKQIPFIQICPTEIEGFTNVSISNFNVSSYSAYFDQFKFGFKISSQVLNQVYFSNIAFNRGYEGPKNVLLIQINNLINNLIMQGVQFSNLTYNNSQVIQLQYSQEIVDSNLQISLDSINIYNVTLNTSSFVQINQNNTIVNFKNSLIQFSNLDNFTDFLSYSIFNQRFIQIISISNITIKNNTISNYSRIFSCNQFIGASISDISVSFSTAPIHIQSQLEDTLIINNLVVQDSFLQYTIKANEAPSQIATCAYLEALIGEIKLSDSNFQNVLSVQKNNCLVVQTKQFIVNNSIFKNEYSKIDSSNSTVKGGFIQLFAQVAKITNCYFEGGKAFQGGAVYIVFNILGFLNIQNSSFINNLSFNQFNSQNFGGALFIDSQTCNFQAEIKQTSFMQNIAFYLGGAIFIQNSSFKKIISIIYSEFIDNFSQYGSVLYFDFSERQNNIFILTDCQLSYNPLTIQETIQKQKVQKNFGQLYFNVQQLFLRGFLEISILKSQFIAGQQYQYTSLTQKKYGIKTYFQIEETQYFIDQNNQYQNISYQVSLISLLNIQQVNILNSKFISILSFTANRFIQINSNYTQIYGTQFQYNQCMECDKGLVQLNSYYLNVINSVFEQNQVLDKGALYISQIKIFNSNQNYRILEGASDFNYPLRLSFIKFKNNISQKSAGAVYIDSSSASFFNCTFIQNTAQKGNGGAIYYFGLEKITNIQIQKSSFVLNIAQIGGAIYSETGQPVQNIQSQNYFEKNTANQFSSSTYQYPSKIVALINETNLVKDKILHTSGKIKTDVSIQLMTQDDQFFKQYSQNMTLNIQLNDTQKAYLSSQQIVQQSGNFQLNSLVLYGVFGLTLKLTFTSDIIKYPKYDQKTGEIVSYEPQFNSVDVIFQFVEGCELGYQHYQMQQYDFCARCSDPFYNTLPGQRCLKCPSYAVCDGGMMYLKEGYWKLNLNSSDIYQCNQEVNTCSGDIDIQQSKGKITRNNQIRYCQKGFLGPLCSDCDLYGKYWNDSYVQDGSLGCINCSQTVNTTWIYVLIILFNSIITLYMVNSQLKQVARSLQIKILFLLKIYIPKNSLQTNFYIKLITSYLQIFMIVSDIIKSQLYKYQVFISPLSDPNKKALFSLDCSLIDYYKSYKLNYIIVKVLFGQVTIITYILIFILLYLFQRKITKQKIHFRDFFSGINFIYLVNQPSIVQQIIGSAVCVEQYGKVYVRNYPSFDCNQEFYKNRNYFLIPLLGFWTILIPLTLFFKLNKIRFTLNKQKNLKVLGIFYIDFKEKFYFWELVKISLKSIIVIVNNYFIEDQNPLKAAMLCFILLAYSILIKQYQPNINKTLNLMEQQIYTLCSISIGLCSYLSDNQMSQLPSSKNAIFLEFTQKSQFENLDLYPSKTTAQQIPKQDEGYNHGIMAQNKIR
ncbi:hypothetical protein ABPG72_015939 [Tetrahymena utriculariae]